jgi:hypothetical protein
MRNKKEKRRRKKGRKSNQEKEKIMKMRERSDKGVEITEVGKIK